MLGHRASDDQFLQTNNSSKQRQNKSSTAIRWYDRFGSSTAALLAPPHGCSTVNTGHQGTTLSIRAPVQISTAAEIQRFDRLLKARTTYMSADARRRIWESTMSLEERLEHYGRILPLPDEKPEAEAQPNEFADLQPAAKSDIVESE